MKPCPDTFPFPLVALDETASTNQYLSQLCNQLQESVAELTTVTAEFQTAGKGQRGNTWEAEEGKNLLFSFVLYPTFLEARRQFILSQIVSLSIKEELERIYTEYGRYLNKVDSFEFPGLSGMDKMADIMQNLRVNPPKDFAGDKVVKVVDYKKPEETGLPAANVLIYTLESGATVVVRPSGTEPKIKTYFTTKGKDLAEAEAQKEKLAEACKPLLA